MLTPKDWYQCINVSRLQSHLIRSRPTKPSLHYCGVGDFRYYLLYSLTYISFTLPHAHRALQIQVSKRTQVSSVTNMRNSFCTQQITQQTSSTHLLYIQTSWISDTLTKYAVADASDLNMALTASLLARYGWVSLSIPATISSTSGNPPEHFPAISAFLRYSRKVHDKFTRSYMERRVRTKT